MKKLSLLALWCLISINHDANATLCSDGVLTCRLPDGSLVVTRHAATYYEKYERDHCMENGRSLFKAMVSCQRAGGRFSYAMPQPHEPGEEPDPSTASSW